MFKAALIILLTSPLLWAQIKKTEPATKAAAAPIMADVLDKDFRCEKLTAVPLADMKAALVENCNLNKPFSTSLSRMLSDEVYFYCCHKK
jgi:hypothetical protein